MRKFLVVAILAASLLSGCAGVVNSPAERWRNYKRINDMHLRQFNDDWDSFWLYEQPLELTPYRIDPGIPY